MLIEITIEGVTRTYQGDYDELHSKDWNGRMREFIDDRNDDVARPF